MTPVSPLIKRDPLGALRARVAAPVRNNVLAEFIAWILFSQLDVGQNEESVRLSRNGNQDPLDPECRPDIASCTQTESNPLMKLINSTCDSKNVDSQQQHANPFHHVAVAEREDVSCCRP